MTQTFRSPQIDLAAILSHQHPSIDIRVETFENSSRNFLKAVTGYKNRAITSLSERRKHQAQEKKKLAEKAQAIEAETGQCKLKEVELVAQLEREKEERKDAELTVAGLKRQLATLRDKIASVDTDIEQYRALAQNLHREKNKERSTLSLYASHVSPEARLCEDALSLTIEGVGKGRLLVRFSSIDRADLDREASLVIDISTQTYKVITSSPSLPSMSILVNNLNETRDVYTFVRDVRAAYKLLLDPAEDLP